MDGRSGATGVIRRKKGGAVQEMPVWAGIMMGKTSENCGDTENNLPTVLWQAIEKRARDL